MILYVLYIGKIQTATSCNTNISNSNKLTNNNNKIIDDKRLKRFGDRIASEGEEPATFGLGHHGHGSDRRFTAGRGLVEFLVRTDDV